MIFAQQQELSKNLNTPHVGEVGVVVEGWIVVELDGYVYHCDEHQFILDRWRDRQLITRGYLPLASPVKRSTRIRSFRTF